MTSRESSLSKDIDKLADALERSVAMSHSSPDSSRHSSPGRGSVQIAMAIKTRRPSTAPVASLQPPTGPDAHAYDADQKVLRTDRGHYLVGESIGKGSFGEVFQAVAPLGHPVVLKVIDMTSELDAAPDRAARRAVVRKHSREFKAMTRAHAYHQPLDMAYVDNKLFIALPPLRVDVADSELHARMDAHTRPQVANCMFHDISSDLARAHARGWLHRDPKHENFMTDPKGRVVLIDFGEAMALPANRELVTYDPDVNTDVFAPETFLRHDQSIGCADESLEGERVDTPASEMFSLGLCWATLATGRDTHPFQSDPDAHEAWQNKTHALLPVDPDTGCIRLDALDAVIQTLPEGSRDARLCKFVKAMCEADLTMGSFVALRVLHPKPEQRPTAHDAAMFCKIDDDNAGRAVLRAALPSEARKQAKVDALVRKYEMLLGEKKFDGTHQAR